MQNMKIPVLIKQSDIIFYLIMTEYSHFPPKFRAFCYIFNLNIGRTILITLGKLLKTFERNEMNPLNLGILFMTRGVGSLVGTTIVMKKMIIFQKSHIIISLVLIIQSISLILLPYCLHKYQLHLIFLSIGLSGSIAHCVSEDIIVHGIYDTFDEIINNESVKEHDKIDLHAKIIVILTLTSLLQLLLSDILIECIIISTTMIIASIGILFIPLTQVRFVNIVEKYLSVSSLDDVDDQSNNSPNSINSNQQLLQSTDDYLDSYQNSNPFILGKYDHRDKQVIKIEPSETSRSLVTTTEIYEDMSQLSEMTTSNHIEELFWNKKNMLLILLGMILFSSQGCLVTSAAYLDSFLHESNLLQIYDSSSNTSWRNINEKQYLMCLWIGFCSGRLVGLWRSYTKCTDVETVGNPHRDNNRDEKDIVIHMVFRLIIMSSLGIFTITSIYLIQKYMNLWQFVLSIAIGSVGFTISSIIEYTLELSQIIFSKLHYSEEASRKYSYITHFYLILGSAIIPYTITYIWKVYDNRNISMWIFGFLMSTPFSLLIMYF